MADTGLPHPAKRVAFVSGSGASRGVSHRNEGSVQSPLDFDFFDLLQRVEAGAYDTPAIRSILDQVQRLPYDHWRSMKGLLHTPPIELLAQ